MSRELTDKGERQYARAGGYGKRLSKVRRDVLRREDLAEDETDAGVINTAEIRRLKRLNTLSEARGAHDSAESRKGAQRRSVRHEPREPVPFLALCGYQDLR